MANFYGGIPGPRGPQGEGIQGERGEQGFSIKEVRLSGEFKTESGAENTYEIISTEKEENGDNKIIGTFTVYNGAEGQLEGNTIPVILTEYVDNPTNEKVYSADYINDNLITNAGLEGKGYLTDQDLSNYATKDDIPDLDGYATKNEIPSLNGYATEDYVQEQIGTIEIPSLEGYVTKDVADGAYVAKDQVVGIEGDFKARGTYIAAKANWDNTMDMEPGQIVWVYG